MSATDMLDNRYVASMLVWKYPDISEKFRQATAQSGYNPGAATYGQPGVTPGAPTYGQPGYNPGAQTYGQPGYNLGAPTYGQSDVVREAIPDDQPDFNTETTANSN